MNPTHQPDFAFMRPRLSRWVALGAGSGLSGVAPGTVGTLLAWGVWLVALDKLTAWQQGAIIAAGVWIGIWACSRTADDLGVADHGAIVWDEIIAFWLVLWLTPAGFGWQFSAFLLFRFFDVVKPPPIRWVDRQVSGGWGVMADDLLAACFSLLVLALGKALFL